MRFKQIPLRVPLRLAIAMLVVPMSLAASPALASDADEIPFNAAKILEYHNAERAARGLGGLSRDPRLDSHAQQMAESLAARGALEHSQSVALGLGYASGGQNLVYRAPNINASQANYLWMTSDTHRRNILNPGFTNVGLGLACSIASGKPYPVAVVDFGGTGLRPGIPPQDPIAVPTGALQGHSLVCDGSAAPAPAAVPPLELPKPAEEKPALALIAVSSDRATSGWGALIAGCASAPMLAGVAGGVWYRLRPVRDEVRESR